MDILMLGHMYLPTIVLMDSQHGLVAARQLRAAGLTANDVRGLLRAGSLLRTATLSEPA